MVAVAMLLAVACSSASVQSTPQPTPSGPPPGFTAGAYDGTTSGGAAYKIEAPTNWNGTLLLGDEYNAILVQGKPAPVPAAFFRFDPAAFPRPFDAYIK